MTFYGSINLSAVKIRKTELPVLRTELRNKLERTIVQARDIAELGAKAALEALAVHHHEPYGHMSPEERKLRNHLRARTRQLGDKQNRKGELEITHLVWECAYEHWHRMLFARFLAENDLLIEPEMGVAISLEECEELAKEEGKDLWSLASEFAQRMLPQIFRPNDPILKVTFAREHRLKLEKLLDDLEPGVFTASDSLGWVYQFWQTKRKKEVNESGNKIGADELPAVTQLFTEPYMVSFLLDNSLGAWWAARRLTETDLKTTGSEEELRQKASLPGVPMEYLRFIRNGDDTWTPAAGTFDSWPENLSELKLLDPCCGSGHFLVAAFLMLVPMRMKLEDLSAQEAADAVLRENLYGLEIDRRCVELSAFALAMTAWRYPDSGGYRRLPELKVACSGLAISAKREEWLALAGDNTNLRFALDELYKQFKLAPVLGSLINPEIGLAKDSLFELKWDDVDPLLTKALSTEVDYTKTEMGVVAQGIAKAAKILSARYQYVITNPPYLGERKQDEKLREYAKKYFHRGRADLATTFLERLELLAFSNTQCFVLPQNWLYQRSYVKLRKKLLEQGRIRLINQLGANSFATQVGADVLLLVLNGSSDNTFYGINLTLYTSIKEKEVNSCHHNLFRLDSHLLKGHGDSRIVIDERDLNASILEKYAEALAGIQNGDAPKFQRAFWEIDVWSNRWWPQQVTSPISCEYGGLHLIIDYDMRNGHLRETKEVRRIKLHDSDQRGNKAWGKNAIAISLLGELKATLYRGWLLDQSAAVILPKQEKYVLPIFCFCSSDSFNAEVRKIDKKRNVTNATLVKVPFDIDHWAKVAQEKYPNGLPKPYSDDPSQWIFHGHPAQSDEPLHVAVLRLLGYRWPPELDAEMELADEQRDWVTKCGALLEYVDKDGIVCIPSMRGEEPAAGRLRELLSVAFGQNWSPAREQELIKATGANTAAFDDWLCDHFFEQHCKLFHHRPFIWHIWDGRRRDGFHALVNYHKLAEGNGKGRQLLESLTYSYLGDWITRQKEGVRRGEGGAEDRLAAALELQKCLIAIIEGEPPFDIFVRWKPIEKQPIRWEPDINDGVRINIRPFMAQDIPGGRKGAGVLRWKPNIKWSKDRGKEPSRPKEQYPWFWQDGEFTGDRVNDIHLSINDKQKERKEKKTNMKAYDAQALHRKLKEIAD